MDRLTNCLRCLDSIFREKINCPEPPVPVVPTLMTPDDDNDNVSDKGSISLQHKIQKEANLSTSWVKDNNLVCSGSKTKLLIVGTRELTSRDISIEIIVDGHPVKESQRERLLGILVNNVMTWEHHVYGNDDHTGLIQKLSQR